MTLIIGVRFRKSGKVYYFSPAGMDIKRNDHVIVETARGVEYGTVVLAPKEVTDDKVVQLLKPVIRIATPEDDQINRKNEEKEKEAFKICLEKINQHQLDMKLIDSEYTFDKNKLLFYFTADGRIDFRELVKDLAAIFRTRIELRQIGVRDETKMIGGIAICGRPLCCSSYLSDFVPVSIKMAKEQNLSLNPSKISGVCGRLMCCLKNEQEAYEYLNSMLPHIGTTVTTSDGYTGEVQTVSVLKQRVKVLLSLENDEKEIREYPVSELTFKHQYKPSADSANALPEEALDEVALKELEKLEKEDEELKDTSDEKAPEKNVHSNSNRKKKNYNSHGSNHTSRKKNFSEEEQKKNYQKKNYNNRNQHNRNDHASHGNSDHYNGQNMRNGRNSYRTNNKTYHNRSNKGSS